MFKLKDSPLKMTKALLLYSGPRESQSKVDVSSDTQYCKDADYIYLSANFKEKQNINSF